MPYYKTDKAACTDAIAKAKATAEIERDMLEHTLKTVQAIKSERIDKRLATAITNGAPTVKKPRTRWNSETRQDEDYIADVSTYYAGTIEKRTYNDKYIMTLYSDTDREARRMCYFKDKADLEKYLALSIMGLTVYIGNLDALDVDVIVSEYDAAAATIDRINNIPAVGVLHEHIGSVRTR